MSQESTPSSNDIRAWFTFQACLSVVLFLSDFQKAVDTGRELCGSRLQSSQGPWDEAKAGTGVGRLQSSQHSLSKAVTLVHYRFGYSYWRFSCINIRGRPSISFHWSSCNLGSLQIWLQHSTSSFWDLGWVCESIKSFYFQPIVHCVYPRAYCINIRGRKALDNHQSLSKPLEAICELG